MEHGLDLLGCQAVLGRVVADCGNVFEGQSPGPVAPPQPIDLSAAKGTLAVVEEFELPVGHDSRSFLRGGAFSRALNCSAGDGVGQLAIPAAGGGVPNTVFPHCLCRPRGE